MAVKIDFNKFKGTKAKEKLEAQTNAPRQAEATFTPIPGSGLLDASRMPSYVKAWEPKPGTNLVMILPVETTNRNNPSVLNGAIEIGDYDYGLYIWMHFFNGTVAKLSHICLKRNWNKKCARCEEFFRTYEKGVKGSGNREHASSERVLFLVVPFKDVNTPDIENIGIWNSPADPEKGAKIIEKAKDDGDGKGMVPFWYPTDDGRLVQFEYTKPENDYAKYSRVKFINRDTKLAQELAEKYSFSLDALMVVKTFEEMEHDIFGGPESEGSHEEAPETHAACTANSEPEMAPDAFGTPEPEATKEPEEATEEKPKPTTAPVESKAPEGSKCPYGHVFGEEWSEHKGETGCGKCKIDHRATAIACADAFSEGA